ncbi:MAG TPA: cupin domain-containing protein [Petrotogaceae bacterium]|nr:cupin domain-containing protein [Petrotogaceae bacterium]
MNEIKLNSLINAVDSFFKKNPDADFDKLDLFLKENYDQTDIDAYYEMLGQTLGSMDGVIENPMNAFLEGPKEKVKSYPGVTVVEFPMEERLRSLAVKEWEIWEKDISEFDHIYDSTETFFVLEGRALLEFKTHKVEVEAGDLVQIEKGAKCHWSIKEPVRKYYTFDIKEI